MIKWCQVCFKWMHKISRLSKQQWRDASFWVLLQRILLTHCVNLEFDLMGQLIGFRNQRTLHGLQPIWCVSWANRCLSAHDLDVESSQRDTDIITGILCFLVRSHGENAPNKNPADDNLHMTKGHAIFWMRMCSWKFSFWFHNERYVGGIAWPLSTWTLQVRAMRALKYDYGKTFEFNQVVRIFRHTNNLVYKVNAIRRLFQMALQLQCSVVVKLVMTAGQILE